MIMSRRPQPQPPSSRPDPGRGGSDRVRGSWTTNSACSGAVSTSESVAGGHRPLDDYPDQPEGRWPGQPQRQTQLLARSGPDGERVGPAERHPPAQPAPAAASSPASCAASTRPRATGTWRGTMLRSLSELDQMKA